MVQGGIQLLVSLLNSGAAHLEAALWALQSVIALHPANQAAAVQTGALSKLVGLLETGPDTAVAEYAADCLCFLAQVTSTLFHHLSTLQVMYHCSSYSASKFLSFNSWWWLAAASAEHSLRGVCSCSVPDWQLVSIVEYNRMSMLQYMPPKILSFIRVHPAIRTHEHGLQHAVFVRHVCSAGAQGSLQDQDAVCAAGAMVPLLDIIAAGPDQLAAKSAALAISALASNHTANQDAFRLLHSNLRQCSLPGTCSGGSACVVAHEHAGLKRTTY